MRAIPSPRLGQRSGMTPELLASYSRGMSRNSRSFRHFLLRGVAIAVALLLLLVALLTLVWFYALPEGIFE